MRLLTKAMDIAPKWLVMYASGSKARTHARAVFPCIVLLFSLNVVRLAVPRLRTLRPGTPAPYTSVLKTVGMTGGKVHVGNDEWAVRSDGSQMYSATYADHPTGRTFYFSSGDTVTAAVDRREKTTLPRQHSGPDWVRDPRSGCLLSITGGRISAEERSLGEESVSGYRAVKMKLGSLMTWYSLDHGCAPIRQRVASSEGGYSEKTLVSLTLGEPDKELFDLSGYKEVAPSVLFGCATCSQSPATTRRLQSMDRIYAARHAGIAK